MDTTDSPSRKIDHHNNDTKEWLLSQASIDDLADIMQLEQHWGEAGRGEEKKFISRLQKFPQGFYIARDAKSMHPVASITSCPIRYQPADLTAFKNWFTATNNGFLADNLDPTQPTANGENALYIVSGIIDPDYRGTELFALSVNKIIDSAKALGLDYVLAGAVIPGYKKYCDKNGNTKAYDYVSKRKGKRLIDPLMSMYEKIGFHVRDADHVIQDYFPDVSSLDYAALVVKKL